MLGGRGDRKGAQGIGGDHPRGDGGCPIFRIKRPQRNVFPFLDVSGTPVVDNDKPENMVDSFIHRNWSASTIPWPNKTSLRFVKFEGRGVNDFWWRR